MEGAGVRLNRAFGNSEVPLLDPFLLLDDFGSDNPADYMAGFPWHPHRGIETVTYMLRGEVEHGDSIGNTGVIQSGDVQWMTAGSGIIHQEMPRESDDYMRGFQLWVNLPSTHKMMGPRYRGVTEDQIPFISPEENVRIRVVCGNVGGVEGPVQDLVVDAEYYDIAVLPHREFEKRVKTGYTAFAYVIAGNGYFDPDKAEVFENGHLVVFHPGDTVRAIAGHETFRFLFVAGQPLHEPVAWGGPIVMNTRQELELAFQEYRNGTFIKHRR